MCGQNVLRCQDYILIDDGLRVTEICGNKSSSSFVATQSSSLRITFRSSETMGGAGFGIVVACFSGQSKWPLTSHLHTIIMCTTSLCDIINIYVAALCKL